MAAGSYRELIKIQSPSSTQNEYGEVDSTNWVDFLSTRASFEPLTGRELQAVEHTGSQVDVRFRLRYRSGILPSYRVAYRGAYYQIIYEPIDVGGDHKELLLYCKKVS